MTQTLISLIMPEILPKVREGAQGNGVQLDKTDCERLLQVFKASVTIETLIEQMAELIQHTLDPPNPDETPDGEPIG